MVGTHSKFVVAAVAVSCQEERPSIGTLSWAKTSSCLSNTNNNEVQLSKQSDKLFGGDDVQRRQLISLVVTTK